METKTVLIKCPICKGRKDPQEFLSASGDRTVKTCKACRARVGAWAIANPEACKASRDAHAEQNNQRASDWYYDNYERALATRKIWRDENMTPERSRVYQETWLSKPENKAKARAWVSAWMKAHPEKMRESYKRWYVENQSTLRFLADRRRRAYGASDFTFEDWLVILEVFGHACAYCLRGDVKLTMDHVTPLSKGGEHTAENIVPACKSCNSKKNNRPIFLMVGKAA
jgi:5-methylcytosine-specific restriction endonuclease McrA